MMKQNKEFKTVTIKLAPGRSSYGLAWVPPGPAPPIVISFYSILHWLWPWARLTRVGRIKSFVVILSAFRCGTARSPILTWSHVIQRCPPERTKNNKSIVVFVMFINLEESRNVNLNGTKRLTGTSIVISKISQPLVPVFFARSNIRSHLNM